MGALRGKACLKGQGEAMRRNTGLHWICPRGSRGNLCQKRVSGAERKWMAGREGEVGGCRRREGRGSSDGEGSRQLRCVCVRVRARAYVCLVSNGRHTRKWTFAMYMSLVIQLISSHLKPALLAFPIAPLFSQFPDLDPWIYLWPHPNCCQVFFLVSLL